MRRCLTGIVALGAVICYAAISHAAPPSHHGPHGNPHHAAENHEFAHGHSFWQHDHRHGGLAYGAFYNYPAPRVVPSFVGPVCAPVTYVAPPIYSVPPSLGFGYSSPGFSFWYSR